MSLPDRKQALTKALQDPEELVRAAASRALDRVEGLERLATIIETASGGEKPNRIRAIHFLGFLGTDESVDAMLRHFQDPEPDIRVAAVAPPCRAQPRQARTVHPASATVASTLST